MVTFNHTSRIRSYTDPKTYMQGVVLPHSDRVFFRSDLGKLDQKIEKTKNHINHLTHAQSHRNTHGGTRFRARQISLKGQIRTFSERLTLLESVKKELGKQKQEFLARTTAVANLAQRILGINSQSVKSYVEGQSSYSSFLGGRKITVLHPVY